MPVSRAYIYTTRRLSFQPKVMLTRWLLAALVVPFLPSYAHAGEAGIGAQTVVHILDYIGVDYSGAQTMRRFAKVS